MQQSVVTRVLPLTKNHDKLPLELMTIQISLLYIIIAGGKDKNIHVGVRIYMATGKWADTRAQPSSEDGQVQRLHSSCKLE